MNNQKPRFPGQIGETKIQVIEEKFSNYGTYVWVKPNGKPFMDSDKNALSIEGMRDDKSRIKALHDAATYWGQPDGRAVFYPNMKKISDEEHSEQVDRMKQGLIPSMNDLGALTAAKKTLDLYGDEG
jgi:hypothetical protein|tara:strand:+ start:136 stop:516 length:381 start_codon:yes stop_codon:yes gene_type:complete